MAKFADRLFWFGDLTLVTHCSNVIHNTQINQTGRGKYLKCPRKEQQFNMARKQPGNSLGPFGCTKPVEFLGLVFKNSCFGDAERMGSKNCGIRNI